MVPFLQVHLAQNGLLKFSHHFSHQEMTIPFAPVCVGPVTKEKRDATVSLLFGKCFIIRRSLQLQLCNPTIAGTSYEVLRIRGSEWRKCWGFDLLSLFFSFSFLEDNTKHILTWHFQKCKSGWACLLIV